MKTWNWIKLLIRPFYGRMIFNLILELISLCLTLVFIWQSKKAIDYAIVKDFPLLINSSIYLSSSLLLSISCSLIANRLNEKLRHNMQYYLQNKLIKKYMHSTWSSFIKWESGDVYERINADSKELVQVLSNTSIQSIIQICRLIAALAFLFYLDSTLTILIILLLPIILLSKLYYQKIRVLNNSLKESESRFTQLAQENFRMLLSIKTSNLLNKRIELIDENMKEAKDIKLKILNYSSFSKYILNISLNIAFLVALIWGIINLYEGLITFGTLSAFLQLVARIQGPSIQLMSYLPIFIKFKTSLNRVIELEDSILIDENKEAFLSDIHKIQINNVSFSYNESLIVSNFSASLHKGIPTVIIGESGKGKTTLLRLLSGIIAPNAGALEIQTDSGLVKFKSKYSNNFTFASQHEELFSGTIYENFRMIKSNVTDEEILNVLNIACADFVINLKDGLNTEIGEEGVGISEGQMQRLLIARSLIRDSHVWLFDEVTSALDSKTSIALVKNILKAGKNKIIVFVTHDKEIINLFEQRIEL